MKSLYGDYNAGKVRHGYPIFVDKEALDSVLEGTVPSAWRSADYRTSNAYLILLDMQWFDAQERERICLETPNAEGSNDDDNEESDDKEVGWTKVSVVNIIPRLYSLLMSDLWEIVYVKPPKIARFP